MAKSIYHKTSEQQFEIIKKLVEKGDKLKLTQLICDAYETGRAEALEEEQPN